jgi:hypothetical protein
MKTIKNILFVTLLFGFILSSCEIDPSVNVDPNNIAEKNVKSVDGIYSLFVALQVNVGDTYTRDRSRLFSIWSWQMCAPPGIARAQPVEWNEYFITTDGPTDDYWVITYRGVKIANDIIEFTPEVFTDNNATKGNAISGIAKVYKALLLGEAAATYGSIPIEIVGTTPPDFVDQQTAYAYVQTLLDGAIADFAKGTATLTRDLNFAGDAAKWTAVANSLKARYYLHIGDYAKAYTAANSGIASAAGSIYGFFSDNTGEHAQWGMWVQDEQETIRGEKYFVDLLKSEPGDTRLSTYFSPNSDGKYFGFAVHTANKYPKAVDTNELKVASCVRMKKYSTYAEKFPLIRFEENVLIKAECEARANQIPAAVANINIIRTQNGLTAFNGTNPVAVATEALKQKFLELYLEGQAWHDMRRTGSLPDVIATGTVTNLRLFYGESEKNANPKVPNEDNYKDLVKWLLNVKYGGLNP